MFQEKLQAFKKFVYFNRIRISLVLLFLILIFASGILLRQERASEPVTSQVLTPTPISSPAQSPFTVYTRPVLEKSDRYDIFLIGDSMTDALGPRGGIFTELLSKEYPGIFFEVSNYAESESILALPEHLTQTHQADHDLLLSPVLEGEPDVIIVESYGYNPPSQLGRVEGLKKQEEILTQMMTKLTNKFPDTVIMFMATIAPDKKTYGFKVNAASSDERWAQGEERIEYITNHIKYAEAHNIPVINVYHESLDGTGDGDTKYINPDDNIHPSAEGLALMARTMVESISEEGIFLGN